jgi:hypothetical protein
VVLQRAAQKIEHLRLRVTACGQHIHLTYVNPADDPRNQH